MVVEVGYSEFGLERDHDFELGPTETRIGPATVPMGILLLESGPMTVEMVFGLGVESEKMVELKTLELVVVEGLMGRMDQPLKPLELLSPKQRTALPWVRLAKGP